MEDVARQLEQLLRGAVEARGLELLHLEYQAGKPNSTLRIYIDKPGGVNIKDCESVSRHIAVLLDVEDLIPHQYLLEVSSPGIERPLFKESDYQRYRGKEIRLVTREKIEERKNFTGVIQDCGEGILHLECAGKIYQIPFHNIRKANLVYHFR